MYWPLGPPWVVAVASLGPEGKCPQPRGQERGQGGSLWRCPRGLAGRARAHTHTASFALSSEMTAVRMGRENEDARTPGALGGLLRGPQANAPPRCRHLCRPPCRYPHSHAWGQRGCGSVCPRSRGFLWETRRPLPTASPHPRSGRRLGDSRMAPLVTSRARGEPAGAHRLPGLAVRTPPCSGVSAGAGPPPSVHAGASGWLQSSDCDRSNCNRLCRPSVWMYFSL